MFSIQTSFEIIKHLGCFSKHDEMLDPDTVFVRLFQGYET